MRTGDLRNDKNLSAYQVDNNLLGLGSYIDENGDQTISTLSTFCVNSGNVDSLGNPSIMSFVEGFSFINFNVGGSYPDLVMTNYLGQTVTLDSIQSYDCSELSDGAYLVCCSLDGEVSVYNSTLYIQQTEPSTPTLNDIWLDVSTQPVKALIYNYESTWEEYLGVPIGRVNVGGGLVQSCNDFPFNREVNNNYNNYNRMTNCIIETPQNLFWEEIEDGVRLKAGSKITVPNGFEEDGTTLKFDTIVTTEDLDCVYTSTGTANSLLFINNVGNLVSNNIANTTSGTTEPTSGSVLWYDTTNNLMKFYSSGTFAYSDCSLPLGIFNMGTKKLTQSFNHMGFIGTSYFIHKGVKFLTADGRNNDGTLKNKVLSIDNIATFGYASGSSYADAICTPTYNFNTESAYLVNWSAINNKRCFKVKTIGDAQPTTNNGVHVAFADDTNKCYTFWRTGNITTWTENEVFIAPIQFTFSSDGMYIKSMQIPETMSLLNNDLGNLSATGINNLIQYAHKLDWDNAIIVSTTNSTSANTFTPNVDGMLSLYIHTQSASAGQTKSVTAYLQRGTDYLSYIRYGGDASQYAGSYLIPVENSIIYTYLCNAIGGTTNTTLLRFIPYKKSL